MMSIEIEFKEKHMEFKKHSNDWKQGVIKALLKLLKEKDHYTYDHSRRVSKYALLLAREAQLNEKDQKIVEYSALFHDLGKIGISDSILLKPEKLSPIESQMMQAHPVKGIEVISSIDDPFFQSLLPGIRNHHERFDGKGYPDQLKAEGIPLAARIILIMDTFDAMTSTRPYRKGIDASIAYAELKKFSGTQFDKDLVDLFIKAHASWKGQSSYSSLLKDIA